MNLGRQFAILILSGLTATACGDESDRSDQPGDQYSSAERVESSENAGDTGNSSGSAATGVIAPPGGDWPSSFSTEYSDIDFSLFEYGGSLPPSGKTFSLGGCLDEIQFSGGLLIWRRVRSKNWSCDEADADYSVTYRMRVSVPRPHIINLQIDRINLTALTPTGATAINRADCGFTIRSKQTMEVSGAECEGYLPVPFVTRLPPRGAIRESVFEYDSRDQVFFLARGTLPFSYSQDRLTSMSFPQEYRLAD